MEKEKENKVRSLRKAPRNAQRLIEMHNFIMVQLSWTGIMKKNDTLEGRSKRANCSISVYPENVMIIRRHGDRS